MSLLSRYQDKWNEYTDHWRDQYREHKSEWEIAGVVVGTILAGPAVAGAYGAVKTANLTAAQTEAVRAASKSLAQNPIGTQQDAAATGGVPSIGATGELQLPASMTGWLPLLLLFVVVMYFLFKD